MGVDNEQLQVITKPKERVLATFNRLFIFVTSAVFMATEVGSPLGLTSAIRRNRCVKKIANMAPYSRPSRTIGSMTPNVMETMKPSGRLLGFRRQVFQAFFVSTDPPIPKTGIVCVRKANTQQDRIKLVMAALLVIFWIIRNPTSPF